MTVILAKIMNEEIWLKIPSSYLECSVFSYYTFWWVITSLFMVFTTGTSSKVQLYQRVRIGLNDMLMRYVLKRKDGLTTKGVSDRCPATYLPFLSSNLVVCLGSNTHRKYLEGRYRVWRLNQETSIVILLM